MEGEKIPSKIEARNDLRKIANDVQKSIFFVYGLIPKADLIFYLIIAFNNLNRFYIIMKKKKVLANLKVADPVHLDTQRFSNVDAGFECVCNGINTNVTSSF